MICPTPCDPDCDPEMCHERHNVPWKRDHDPEMCEAAMDRQMSVNPTEPVDKDAEIARLKRELEEAKALSIKPAAEENTEAWYWVSTMRGEQPRCRNCDGSLTRGPKGGVTDSYCPNCGAELRSGLARTETR